MTDEMKINQLELILHDYALKSNVENATELIYKMRLNKARVKDYIYALADGLKYGNWPWITNSAKELIKCQCGAQFNSDIDVCICGITPIDPRENK